MATAMEHNNPQSKKKRYFIQAGNSNWFDPRDPTPPMEAPPLHYGCSK